MKHQTRRAAVQGTWAYSAPALKKRGSLRKGKAVTILREIDNPYDSNAAAVYLGSGKLGMLPKDLAKELAPYLDSNNNYSAEITTVGSKTFRGNKYPTASIKIDLLDWQEPDAIGKLLDKASTFSGTSGIFLIENKVDGRGYIGSSVNVGNQLRRSINALRQGTHKNSNLQSAWRQCGAQAFDITLLKSVSERDLEHEKIAHIQQLGTFRTGYNKTRDGMGALPIQTPPQPQPRPTQRPPVIPQPQRAPEPRSQPRPASRPALRRTEKLLQPYRPERSKTGCLTVMVCCILAASVSIIHFL